MVLANYEDTAFRLGTFKNTQWENREDIEASSSSTFLDAILSDIDHLKTEIRKEERKPIRGEVMKMISEINKLIENEDSVLPEYSDGEKQNPQQKNQEQLEVSSIPTDPHEWERRKHLREEERIKRQAMRPPTTDCEDNVLFFGGENQKAKGKNREEIEVSSIPTDPQERKRRMTRREEERIKRQAVRPPDNFEEDLLYFGENYKMEFAKKAKKGYKDMGEIYPDLEKVLASLNTTEDRTYEQNPKSVTPLDPMSKTPSDQMCVSPISQMCMSPISPMCMTPISPMSITPFDQMCLSPISQMCMSPISPMCMSPISPMSMTSINSICMMPLDQMSATTLDQMNVTTPDQMIATTPDQMSATTLDQMNVTTPDQMIATTPDQMSATTLDQMNVTTPDQMIATTPDQMSATTLDQMNATTPDQMSATTLDQNINENVNTGNVRLDMVSEAASPDHRPLESANPAPGPTRPEAAALLHVRTVEEINALPRDLFIRLVTPEEAAMSGPYIGAERYSLSE